MRDDERIRFIFRGRRNFSRAKAAAALGRSVQWVESKRLLPENGDFVQWEEMVLLADGIWTKLQIHRALGEEAKNIFPPLALLAPLTVQIPICKVIAVRHEARRRHTDVSELVGDDICVYGDEAEWLERQYPGYVAALHFPYSD